MSLDPSSFRSVVGRFASGVTVLTARDDAGTDHGMTVSAFCSVSLIPSLVLVCIEEHAEMYGVLQTASRFAINVLSVTQEPLARRFAEKTGDRFGGIGFTRGVTGAALLHDAHAFIECTIVDRHRAGDHSVMIGEVVAAGAGSDQPLIYYRGGYAQLQR